MEVVRYPSTGQGLTCFVLLKRFTQRTKVILNPQSTEQWNGGLLGCVEGGRTYEQVCVFRALFSQRNRIRTKITRTTRGANKATLKHQLMAGGSAGRTYPSHVGSVHYSARSGVLQKHTHAHRKGTKGYINDMILLAVELLLLLCLSMVVIGCAGEYVTCCSS